DTLGYDGVVISDAMLMGALVNQYGLDTAIVLAVNAGVDILVYTVYEKDSITNMLAFVVNTIYQKVLDGDITEERINESFDRIMNLKQKYALVSITSNENIAPNDYQLTNYPNPFNSTTTIVFDIPIMSNIKIKLYNILGEEIKTIINDFKNAGKYSLQVDFNELPSGVYIITMFSENNIISRKVTLLK
ncbi:MAG: T9SS type A sorting domain-containing protein, partial [Ignavibacteriales bacterium]|nr:T9SS type A sorting domain-containing protein [Ignavibacteriales bacterium]